jgi:hypothetical protein
MAPDCRCPECAIILFLLLLLSGVFWREAGANTPTGTVLTSRTVRTAEELQLATEEGVKLIIITEHLNLRLLPPVKGTTLSAGLLRVSSTVVIQVGLQFCQYRAPLKFRSCMATALSTKLQ